MAKSEKEKWYEVRRSPKHVAAKISGKQKTGCLYQRGGYKFCDEPCTDNPLGDYVQVPESELDKFMIIISPKFATGAWEKIFDPNLIKREIPAPETIDA